MSSIQGALQNASSTTYSVVVSNANPTLPLYPSGSTIMVTCPASAGSLTLPSPSLGGLQYRLICGSATMANAVAITSPTAGTIFGDFLIGPTATIAVIRKNGTTTFNWLAASVQGDIVDLYADGTNWNVRGFSGLIGFS